MKYIKEFLVENSLEDLRRDLMGLGYERWEVSMEGIATFKRGPNSWMSYNVWCKGVGGSKESALRLTIQALYESVQSGNPVDNVKMEWKGGIGNIKFRDVEVIRLVDIFSTQIEGEVECRFDFSKELESYANCLPEFIGEYYKENGTIYKR